ncbi:MAG: DinB family protein [Burkholderiales bacterium]
MNPKIESQLQLIDSKLAHLLADLQQYSEAILNRQPSPNGWSILQVLQHLMLVELASEKYVRKKLSYNPKLPKINLGTAWRMLLLKSYNWLPLKLKAPSYVNENNFPANPVLAELGEKWQEQRRQLRDFLATLPNDIFDKEVYKHPLVGRLSLGGMLQFYEGHFDRHQKQIKKLLTV